jgi:hypothetical protein
MRAAALRALPLIAAVALCFAAPLFAAPGGRAILVLGADSIKGLPFFSPNAIRALSGAYELGLAGKTPQALSPSSSSTPRIAVWYTREALVLGPEWKRLELGGSRAYSLARGGGAVVALRADRYTLFFEPGPVPEGKARAFMLAFERKFLAFFENAPSDAELSFPAFVDF